MTTRFARWSATAASGAFLCGCAHLPDVTVGYYLAQSTASFKVVRTVACDAADNVIVASTATPTVRHSADPGQFKQIRLSDLKGPFSDTDIKFTFTDDGRLSSVNATSEGQGEAILKSVVSIAAAAVGGGGGRGVRPFKNECDTIRKDGGGKPLTITYEGEVPLGNGPLPRRPIPSDSTYATTLASAIGTVCADVLGAQPANAPVGATVQPGDVILHARQPSLVNIVIMAGPAASCRNIVWEGKLPVGQFGTPYVLPIPAAAVFGKEVFAVTFADSGALSSVQYVTNTGTGQVLNVANAGLTAFKPETTAQKAAAVQAEADLIAQQQRLVQCLADPSSCK